MRRVFVSFFIDVEADGVAAAFHRQVRLAVAGQAVLVSQSIRVKYIANLMRGMTVDTGRDLARIFCPQFAFDHLAMHIFNLAVTGGTCLTNIVRVDALFRIGMRQDVMRSVAGGADGCDGEALREQAFTVNTHRVILEDVLLGYLVST